MKILSTFFSILLISIVCKAQCTQWQQVLQNNKNLYVLPLQQTMQSDGSTYCSGQTTGDIQAFGRTIIHYGLAKARSTVYLSKIRNNGSLAWIIQSTTDTRGNSFSMPYPEYIDGRIVLNYTVTGNQIMINGTTLINNFGTTWYEIHIDTASGEIKKSIPIMYSYGSDLTDNFTNIVSYNDKRANLFAINTKRKIYDMAGKVVVDSTGYNGAHIIAKYNTTPLTLKSFSIINNEINGLYSNTDFQRILSLNNNYLIVGTFSDSTIKIAGKTINNITFQYSGGNCFVLELTSNLNYDNFIKINNSNDVSLFESVIINGSLSIFAESGFFNINDTPLTIPPPYYGNQIIVLKYQNRKIEYVRTIGSPKPLVTTLYTNGNDAFYNISFEDSLYAFGNLFTKQTSTAKQGVILKTSPSSTSIDKVYRYTNTGIGGMAVLYAKGDNMIVSMSTTKILNYPNGQVYTAQNQGGGYAYAISNICESDFKTSISTYPSRNISISIYPNPTTSTLNIKGLDGMHQVQIRLQSMNGTITEALYQGNAGELMQLNVPNHIASGLYLITVRNNKQVYTAKISVIR
ncbi:MAG: T9SS type A sorting domain-containing protein [Bacteroidota bacterium]|nr:T9SS type A sorting domain-containing protein [Bacteroidota bacterium]